MFLISVLSALQVNMETDVITVGTSESLQQMVRSVGSSVENMFLMTYAVIACSVFQ